MKLVTVSSFYPLTLNSVCLCHWCCLSSAWSSRHWSPCRRLWRLCRDVKLILPVLLPLLLLHRCNQQSGDWWLFCLQCWQCLRDLLRRLSWSFQEIYWRGWMRVDIPVGLQLLIGTSLLLLLKRTALVRLYNLCTLSTITTKKWNLPFKFIRVLQACPGRVLPGIKKNLISFRGILCGVKLIKIVTVFRGLLFVLTVWPACNCLPFAKLFAVAVLDVTDMTSEVD